MINVINSSTGVFLTSLEFFDSFSKISTISLILSKSLTCTIIKLPLSVHPILTQETDNTLIIPGTSQLSREQLSPIRNKMLFTHKFQCMFFAFVVVFAKHTSMEKPMGKCHRVLSASISYTGRTSNPFAFTARCYSWKISLPARNNQRGEHAQLKFLFSL